MRRLMWFTLGFGAACALCGYLFPGELLLILAGGTLTGSVVMGLLSRNYRNLRGAVLVLLGCSLGFGWYLGFYSLYLNAAVNMDGKTETVSIRTSDYSSRTDYGMTADGILSLEGKNYPVRVYLEAGEAIAPGTILEGAFRFRVTTPEGEEAASYYAEKGIFLLAYQDKEVSLTQGEDVTLREWASVLRQRIKAILEECLPEDAAPFAKSLLLGDTEELTYEVDTRLKISGIRHVAAVSGLHVSILFALVSTVTFRRRYLTALAGLPVLFLFAALAGFTPSVNRACLMSALMLLALLLNREYDGATALSFSVLVMLLANPLSVTSVSLQLSVASVAGIFLFCGPIQSWLMARLGKPMGKGLRSRLKRWLAASIASSLSATVLTAPLSAWYFGTVSLIGVVTNLLTLWVISVVFYGLMAVCAVYFVSAGAAIGVGKLTGWLIRWVLEIAGILSGFPLACVYTASPYITLWLIFVYALLAAFLMSRKKRPGVFTLCAGFGLCLALLCSWAEPLLYDTVITVLDVGQGQCVLLQSEGKSYVVDCGGDSDSAAADAAAELLLSRGIHKLDGLILTHMDRDHAGGGELLLSRLAADLVILPPVHNSFDPKGAEAIYADRELDLTWGSSTLRIFGEKTQESDNENGLCILLDTEKCDILITGDRNSRGEARLLEMAQIPAVDVLLAGHHGSNNASSEVLLEALTPEIVCISVGENNRYGHPAPETLERLNRFGCRIYRTDAHGTITIRR